MPDTLANLMVLTQIAVMNWWDTHAYDLKELREFDAHCCDGRWGWKLNPFIWCIMGASLRRRWGDRMHLAFKDYGFPATGELSNEQSADSDSRSTIFSQRCARAREKVASAIRGRPKKFNFEAGTPPALYVQSVKEIGDDKEVTRFTNKLKSQDCNRVVLEVGSVFRCNFTALSALTGNWGCTIVVPHKFSDDKNDKINAQLLDLLELGKKDE